MAVKYDTPWGPIEAENAASEATLQAILAALDKDSAKNKKSQKADEDAAKASEGKAKADRDAAKAGKDFSVGWAAVGNTTVKALKDIGLTAVSMATKFGTDFVNIAENPIKETANMLNTLIDTGAGVASSFLELIPVLGGFLSAATKVAAELAKAANKTFAEQLQRNIDTLQAYNKVGVSFVGGMNQMNKVAHGAGLGLADFSKIVTKSKTDLNFLGMSGGAAATALSNGMGLTTKLIGKSGQSLRNEMFKMGYTYEEQGEVMASYMANMKAAGKLESMTREELARGTRQYAADLKVVADFTGQDAKKLAERARQAQLNVAVQQNLDENQRERLGKATQMLARMGPEGERAQQALTQMLLRGATNVQGYTMGPGREMIETMMNNVKSGQEDVFQNAGRAMSKAQEQTSKDMQQGAVAVAKAFGVAGEASDGIANFQSGLFAMGKIGPEMISNMQNAGEKQAVTADQVADQTAALYDQTKKFQVLMETEVNKELGRYAKLLKEVNDLTMGNFAKFITGGGPTPEEVNKKVDRQVQQEKILPRIGPKETEAEQRARIEKEVRSPLKVFAMADGGKLGAGDLAVTGERGPELISGPASVLSTSSTESLTKTLDAMSEMAGKRFSENNSALKDRIKGFEKVDYNQLQSELAKRSDPTAMTKTKSSGSETTTGASSSIETNTLLAQLVQIMRSNLDQTTRVAMNTN